MKKYIALIIIMALLLPQLMTIPSLADGESSGNSNVITITTGEEFASKVVTANFGKTFIIDGTQTLADGSKGIIITSDSVSGFYGTIKGVEGKNNIQIQEPLIKTVGASGTGNVVIDNIVLKGSNEDGTGALSLGDNVGALISAAATNYAFTVTITNVTNYLDVSSTGSAKTAGGILGYVRYRKVTIENCINKGNISANVGDAAAGGIVGRFYGSSGEVADIKNCSNEGKIESSGCAAGILGKGTPKDGGNIQYCANFGTIKSTSTAGITSGAAGISFHYVPTSYCFNAGNVESDSMAGGIWGTSTTVTALSDCFNLGKVSSTNASCYPAGIVGSQPKTAATVTNCYNLGVITGEKAAQIIDNEKEAQDKACENNYYVSDTALEQAVGTYITSDVLATDLPTGFLSGIWEILPDSLRGDYINDDIDCPSGYRYPQIKGNWIDHKFEADIESFEDYRSSLKGEITNVSTGWDHVENVSNGICIYGTNGSGTKLVKRFTYPALFGSDLIKGDKTSSSDLSFDINKTAEVILAVNTSDVNSLDAVANGGFDQMFEEDGVTPLAFVTDGGLVYYLVKKDVIVSSSETITIGAQSGLPYNFVVFVNWLNTYELSVTKSGNEKVYINGVEKTDDAPTVALGGSSYTIKVEPNANCYIKKITVNDEIAVENSVVEYVNTIVCRGDVNIVIETSEYLLKDSDTLDEILPPDYKVIQSSNASTGHVEQTFRIKGQMESFLNGGTVIAKISKASTPLYTGSVVIDGEGKFEILFPLSNTDEGILEIKLTVEKDGVVSDIPLDASKETFEVSSVADINNLLLNLNTDSITAKELENLILEEKASLPFEVGVFKNTSPDIRGLITTQLVGMDNYSIDNIYSRFDDTVIMCVANNSKNTADYVNIINVYDEIINFSDSSLYAEYEGLTSYEKFAEILKKNTFSSYAELIDAFEYGVIYAELSNITSYDSILGILNTHKTMLGIEAEVTSISNMVDSKIKIVNDETGKALNTLVTKELLKGKLQYLITNADALLAEKMGQTIVPILPPPIVNLGGGGGGGGSSISVEKDYTEKEPSTPVYSEEVVNEFVDLGDVAWAQDHIRSLYKRGIVRGKELGKFYPQDKVTRAEFVKMVVVAFSLMEEEPSCKYVDVTEDHWSYKYVASAADIGIVSGYSKDEFGVDGYITRQDMVAILIRIVYNLSLYEKMENRKISTADFTDIDTVSDYAKGGVVMLANSGIISGYEDGSFGPNNDVTRAEAATVLARVLVFFEI